MNAMLHSNDLSEVLGDEKVFANLNGEAKKPSNPGFIFFDDHREQDPDILWARELALDFEEWVAKRNHEEALDKRTETKLVRRTRRTVIEPRPLVEAQNGGRVVVEPTKKEVKWAKKFNRITGPHSNIVPASKRQEKWFKKHGASIPQPNGRPASIVEDDWDGGHVAERDEESESYHERQESRRYANWLVGFHKKRPKTNDHARELALVAMRHSDKPEAVALLQALKESLPLAPGPIRSTVFINPDGTRHETNGTDFGKAKASYIKKHGVDSEFVTVDRVQYDGQRASKLVVGTRKSSEFALSRYYDPSPTFEERENPQTYRPQATTLILVPASKVVPADSHRLTVRQFERAIIAGAELVDDEIEAYASTLDCTDECPDGRSAILNMGYGDTGRSEASFTHEEAYLYGILRMFGQDEACELMLLADQPQGLLSMHFMAGGEHTETYIDILRFVSDQDRDENEEPMLPYVAMTLSGESDETETVESSYSRHLCHFALAFANDLSDQVESQGYTKRPAHHNWG